MGTICRVHRLGSMDYEQAWRLQERLAGEVAAREQPASLLLLEHPHTYTFGRRGKVENMLWDEAERARRGLSVHWVDRGGDVTYHGPGQLVGYPLLPLAPGGLSSTAQSSGIGLRLPQADYVGYVRRLEAVLIATLMHLGVPARQMKGLTGVWVQPEGARRHWICPPEMQGCPAKIAAIGVKVDARGVSRHGFSLNVAPDMAYWDGIVGCGLKEYPIASLADFFDPPPEMEGVIDLLVAAFGRIFGFEMVESEQPRAG